MSLDPSTPLAGMRAVAVLRASVNAEDRTTLITQESEIRRWAESFSPPIEIVAIFTDDGKSGYDMKAPRPGRDKAMKMIERRQADILVVWKLDRLVRNLREFVKLWDRIESHGGQFISVVEKWADTSTAMGRLMLIIVATFAEMESEMKRDRAIPHARFRKKEGLPPGGPTPFGYRRDEGKLLIVDEEAAMIQEMAAKVLAGASMNSLVTSLKALGTREVPITIRGLRKVLTSPTIAGFRELDGEMIEGNWAGILDETTWEKLRTMLDDPNRRTNFSDGKPAHLLTAIITCAECRKTLRRKNHPDGKRYQCLSCNIGIRMAHADEAVKTFLLSSIDPAAWKQLKEQGRGYEPEVIAALNAELDMLDEMRLSGELTPERYRKQNAAVMQRMAAATNQQPLELPEIADLQSGWEGLDLAEQRTVIKALLGSITLERWDSQSRKASHERIHIRRATY